MSWIEAVDGWIVALVVLALQLVASEVGWTIGARRSHTIESHQRFQASAVQASILALLGLLLAFSFSMAAGRYEARRDLAVEESNAIGTAYLRARVLPAPESDAVRLLLRQYVDARLAFFDAKEPAALEEAIQESETLLGLLWKRVIDPAVGDLSHVSLLVESTNLVIDLHASRVAANDARIPPTILVLLSLVAAAGLGTVGWCFGLVRGPHRGPCLLLSLLVATILLVIVDLDEPQRGRIRVPAESMRHLQRELSVP